MNEQDKQLAPRPSAQIETTSRGVHLATVDDMFRFAMAVHQSELAPRGFNSPQQIFVAIEMGLELGLAPMAALRTIAVINGRPSLWGDGMLGVVMRARELESIEETIEGEIGEDLSKTPDDVQAVCRMKRKGLESVTVKTFSVAQARRANLWGNPKKSPWLEYPERMLQMRARGFALRDLFPDITLGMLTAEEARDIAPDKSFDPEKAKGAEATTITSTPDDPAAKLAQEIAQPPMAGSYESEVAAEQTPASMTPPFRKRNPGIQTPPFQRTQTLTLSGPPSDVEAPEPIIDEPAPEPTPEDEAPEQQPDDVDYLGQIAWVASEALKIPPSQATEVARKWCKNHRINPDKLAGETWERLVRPKLKRETWNRYREVAEAKG